ncbi:MAG: FmdB family transcriptional regulator [Candidatus Binatia bacterium]|nr:MAG: FmdB family transcriptional regulator [Candidatus Binatia bacterium]
MPIYEYQCPKCGRFEIMQRITEDALRRCPKCRSKVTKLISQSSFQFKGSGWYVTDYARAGKQDGKKAEAESSRSETKSEKPEKADESKPKGKESRAAA